MCIVSLYFIPSPFYRSNFKHTVIPLQALTIDYVTYIRQLIKITLVGGSTVRMHWRAVIGDYDQPSEDRSSEESYFYQLSYRININLIVKSIQ